MKSSSLWEYCLLGTLRLVEHPSFLDDIVAE